MTYISHSGVDVAYLRGAVLDAIRIPGRDGLGISDFLIEDQIKTAETVVEADLDIVLGIHKVVCGEKLTEGDDDEDTTIYLSALDKPKNWLAGERNGVLLLPKKPAREILALTVKPYGMFKTPIPIPLGQLRVDKTKLRVVQGAFGWILPITSSTMSVQDHTTIPNGIDLTYTCGLSPGEIKRIPLLKTLTVVQAAILVLTLVQTQIGSGVQKESGGYDGLQNSVELARRDRGGPLGGEITQMRKMYDDLIRRAQSDQALAWVWL